jgi:hypothetical protein
VSLRAPVNVAINKVPLFYNYVIHGSGKMTFKLGNDVKKDSFVLDSHDFNGMLEIK